MFSAAALCSPAKDAGLAALGFVNFSPRGKLGGLFYIYTYGKLTLEEFYVTARQSGAALSKSILHPSALD